jgi:hypothetical protein
MVFYVSIMRINFTEKFVKTGNDSRFTFVVAVLNCRDVLVEVKIKLHPLKLTLD